MNCNIFYFNRIHYLSLSTRFYCECIIVHSVSNCIKCTESHKRRTSEHKRQRVDRSFYNKENICHRDHLSFRSFLFFSLSSEWNSICIFIFIFLEKYQKSAKPNRKYAFEILIMIELKEEEIVNKNWNIFPNSIFLYSLANTIWKTHGWLWTPTSFCPQHDRVP